MASRLAGHSRAAALAALAVGLCAASPASAAGPAAVSKGTSFTCTPTRVWDGDGPIWCAEGPRVRLAGIAAREMDGTCKPRHPCPRASAPAAKAALVALLGGARGQASEGHALVRGPKLICVSEGSAGGSRTAAWCRSLATGDLSCAMVRSGTAERWPRYWREGHCR
jgi:endonuclease YncB( thermonuclease family)